MDKIAHYRAIVQQLMTEYANYGSGSPSDRTVEQELIWDEKNDRYLLLTLGWKNNNHRIYNCFIHLEIRDGKVWIQRNMTDVDLAEELVAQGIAKQDIVLGLHSPFKRQFTDYAVS